MRIILILALFSYYSALSQQPAVLDRLVTIDTNTIWTQKDGYESSDFRVNGIEYFKKIDTSFFIKYKNKGYYLSKDGSGYKIVDMPDINRYKPAAWDVPYDDIHKIFGYEFDAGGIAEYWVTSKKDGKIDSLTYIDYDWRDGSAVHNGGESEIKFFAYKNDVVLLYADYFIIDGGYKYKEHSTYFQNTKDKYTTSISKLYLPNASISSSLNYMMSFNTNLGQIGNNEIDDPDTYNVCNLGDTIKPLRGIYQYGISGMQLSQNSGFLINDSLAIALTYDSLRVYNFHKSTTIKSYYVADKKFFSGYYYDEPSRSVIFNYAGITDNKSYNSVIHLPSLNIIRDTLNDKPYLGRILTRLDDGKYLSHGSGGYLYRFDLDLGLDYAKADFTSELIEKNTFKFIDNSKGPIVKWLWNFGDGNKSNERNLEYKYVKSGSYSVSLVVENEFGTKDTIVTKVEAKDALTAFYTADILGGKAPLTVSFLNRSFGEAVKYIWNFGDGKSSMEENPTHTYTSSGTYSVSLTVIDANGKFDIKLIDELIFVK